MQTQPTTEVNVNDIIEFSSGMRYKVIRLWEDNKADLKATIPQFEWMPKYLPIYYSVILQDYKIIEPEM